MRYLISVIAVLAFLTGFAEAQIRRPLPNNYDTVVSCSGDSITYKVIYKDNVGRNGYHQFVHLHNVNNVMGTEDATLSFGQEYGDLLGTHNVYTYARLTDWNLHQLNEIMQSVFTASELQSIFDYPGADDVHPSYLTIEYVYNPMTGEVLEVMFGMWTHSQDQSIFNITARQLEQIEKLVKQRIVLTVDNSWRGNQVLPYGVLSTNLTVFRRRTDSGLIAY